MQSTIIELRREVEALKAEVAELRGCSVKVKTITTHHDQNGRIATLSTEERQLTGEGLAVVTRAEYAQLRETVSAAAQTIAALTKLVEHVRDESRRSHAASDQSVQALAVFGEAIGYRTKVLSDGRLELSAQPGTQADVVRLGSEVYELTETLKLQMQHAAERALAMQKHFDQYKSLLRPAVQREVENHLVTLMKKSEAVTTP
jgi:hypothetical protein